MRWKARLARRLVVASALAALAVGYQPGSTFKVLAASDTGTAAGNSRTEFALAASSGVDSGARTATSSAYGIAQFL